MIKILLIWVAVSYVATFGFILLEKYAEKYPQSPFTRWWRRNIVSDTHNE